MKIEFEMFEHPKSVANAILASVAAVLAVFSTLFGYLIFKAFIVTSQPGNPSMFSGYAYASIEALFLCAVFVMGCRIFQTRLAQPVIPLAAERA